ncbi:hypothetical protein ACFQZZ_11950 [Nocardia sp. GCM10030253]|uniref:hypothetical protein n=1 Tax=Nocardia sp. GCM10030253 TaxID=3273404 RepID=UPI00362AB88F
MADGSGEPVLVSLTAPARRSLVEGLVRATGSGNRDSAARTVDVDVSDAEIADFLAEVAHADTGFIARTAHGDRALAIIAATVAALCGEDIRAALATPNIAFLTTLKPPAIEAVRTVLLAIETETPDAVTHSLAPLAVADSPR